MFSAAEKRMESSKINSKKNKDYRIQSAIVGYRPGSVAVSKKERYMKSGNQIGISSKGENQKGSRKFNILINRKKDLERGIKEDGSNMLIRKFYRHDNIDSQTVLEPEQIQLRINKLSNQYEESIDKNEFLLEQQSELENYIRDLEKDIDDKKKFFLDNDRGRFIENGVEQGNEGRTGRFDNDLTLLRTMREKLSSIKDKIDKEEKRLDQFYEKTEFTDYFEEKLKVFLQQAELERMNNLKIEIKSEDGHKRIISEAEENQEIDKKISKNTSLSRHLMEKYKQYDEFGSSMNNQRLRSPTHTEQSNIKVKENSLNQDELDFLMNHILEQNLRKSNQTLADNLAILTSQNTKLEYHKKLLTGEIDVQNNENLMLETEIKNKTEILQFFSESFRDEIVEDTKTRRDRVIKQTMVKPSLFNQKSR